MALESFPIHDAAMLGDAALLARRLKEIRGNIAAEIERFDREGRTALMCAVISPRADASIVRTLIDSGASVHRATSHDPEWSRGVLALALGAGNPEKIAEIVRGGANLLYERKTYTAIIDCVHGRDLRRDPRLIELLEYLILHRVELNTESSYSETALRVLSRLGRFDAVKLLLDAGADESQLRWNPLLRAIGFGEASEVRRLVAEGGDVEARDFWERTAFLVAIVAGDLEIARLLAESGADINARGRCARPALFYAVENHDRAMLEWLLQSGLDVSATDQFGTTALIEACEHNFAAGVELLLAAGADVNVKTGVYPPIKSTNSPEIARLLLRAGADPAEISAESRRALIGLPPDPDVRFLTVSTAEFKHGAARRFGKSNPEEFDEPFWIAMIRAGVGGWSASETLNEVSVTNPVWCASRYGQSITFLPDGRVVQVGGEHEDSYDPDFCIYNDVFVHDQATIRIYGYPEKVFPPTDFHTATLLDGKIYLIGSLGYQGTRKLGTTPIYTLDISTFEMQRVRAFGTCPGWIYKHRAELRVNGEILISGGTVAVEIDGKEEQVENDKRHVLDTKTCRWHLS